MKKLLYIIMLALPLVFWACDNDDVDGPSGSGLSIVFPQGTIMTESLCHSRSNMVLWCCINSRMLNSDGL